MLTDLLFTAIPILFEGLLWVVLLVLIGGVLFALASAAYEKLYKLVTGRARWEFVPPSPLPPPKKTVMNQYGLLVKEATAARDAHREQSRRMDELMVQRNTESLLRTLGLSEDD